MPMLKEGQKFERYRVRNRLGSGISGISYDAEDTLLQRKVTLKLIHPQATLPDAARRQFFRDMQSISRISHPYLAEVLDYGEVDGQLYMTRCYVGPGSLLGNEGRLWFHPPLALVDAITYTHQLARALSHIHRHGYIHGSLSLSNILILHGPTTHYLEVFDHVPASSLPFLLADIGITHFVQHYAQQQNTFSGITVAPEQFKRHDVPASDQYALAVLLYFWLAGRPPFTGTPEEMEKLKFSETFPLLTSFNKAVTLEQEGIMRRALSAYPKDRYPSILAFTGALLTSLASSIAGKQPEISPQPEPQITPDIPQPMPQIEPDIPQPIPTPSPIPQPIPEPATPAQPEPPTPIPMEPEVIPTPAPDIPQPIPEPNPFPSSPAPIPPQEPVSASLHAELTLKTLADPPPTYARLFVTSSYLPEPLEVLLDRAETSLGRAGDSDVLLDQGILTSRHHAIVKREDNDYVIYDQRSTYGVTVNGHKIDSEEGYKLTHGDCIGIGEYELVFRLTASQQNLYQSREHSKI